MADFIQFWYDQMDKVDKNIEPIGKAVVDKLNKEIEDIGFLKLMVAANVAEPAISSIQTSVSTISGLNFFAVKFSKENVLEYFELCS